MKLEEYELIDFGFDNDCSYSSDGPINLKPSNRFERGSFSVFVSDEEIGYLDEKGFDSFFSGLTKGFHFYEDWKKAFKGSEFLIPVVEQELDKRKSLLIQQFTSKLYGIKDSYYTVDEVMEQYTEILNEIYKK